MNQINQQRDMTYDQLTKYAIPQYYNELAARGLGNSSAMSQGLNDLMTKAGVQSVYSANDLYNQSLQRKLQSGQFAQSGLNDIYAQMMGIQNAAQAGTNAYMSNAQTNANRLLQGQQYNQNAAQQADQQNFSDMGSLAMVAAAPFTGGASLAALPAFGKGGQQANPYAYMNSAQAPTGNLGYDNQFSGGYQNLFGPSAASGGQSWMPSAPPSNYKFSY